MSVTWQSGKSPDDFQRALNRFTKEVPGKLAEQLNAQAYLFAKQALDFTPRAVRQAIESLGLKTTAVTPYKTSSGKQRFRRKFKFERDPAVTNYINALIHHRGAQQTRQYLQKMAAANLGAKNAKRLSKGKIALAMTAKREGAEIAAQARRWIGKKLRSIGFLASTWRPILRKLDRYASEKGLDREEFRGKPNAIRSYAIPATAQNPVVEFGNVIGTDKYGNELPPYARGLMEAAFNHAKQVRTGKIFRSVEHYLREQAEKSFKQ